MGTTGQEVGGSRSKLVPCPPDSLISPSVLSPSPIPPGHSGGGGLSKVTSFITLIHHKGNMG